MIISLYVYIYTSKYKGICINANICIYIFIFTIQLYFLIDGHSCYHDPREIRWSPLHHQRLIGLPFRHQPVNSCTYICTYKIEARTLVRILLKYVQINYYTYILNVYTYKCLICIVNLLFSLIYLKLP